MAAPKENLLSLGHLTGMERNTKQREHSLKNRPLHLKTDFSTLQSHQHLRVMHLQQRWQELKERELTAKQHNKQLLQQFEKAQDTLREMLARNAAMKTIRMEYERYLEESAPRWQQQLKEKTQAAQRKRMEEYLRSCLKNTEEEQKSSADLLPLSQGLAKNAEKVSTRHENTHSRHSDYNQDVSSNRPFVQSSWLTQSQTARFPVKTPSQLQGSSHVPPFYPTPASNFPHPHQLQLQPLASTSTHHHLHHPWPRQNPPGWGSPQPDYPWSWATGAAGNPSDSEALWGPLCTEEPLHEGGVEAETSRAPSSKRERGGGSRSCSLSQELDIKPVRLSSGHAESSESGKDSIQASREKRKRRGKKSRTSSDRERCSTQESTTTSSAVVVAGITVVQSSESDTSEKRSTSGSKRTRTRSGGLGVGPPRIEEVAKEKNRGKKDDSESQKEESPSTAEESGSQTEESRSENALNQSPDDKSDRYTEEESKSVSIQIENRVAEIEKQKRSSSAEESSAQEKDEEERFEDLGEGDDGEEKEDSQRNEGKEERDAEEDSDDVSSTKNTTEENEETEDELDDLGNDEDNLKNEEGENREQGSATSQDEVVNKDESESDDEEGSDEGEEEEEEKRSDEAEEERDSEDSIISPQENRQKKIHIIPEEADEDDNEQKGSGTAYEDPNGFSEDDVEELLAPQEQTKKKEEKDLKVDNKSEETCDVEIFQVELDNSAKTDHQSDCDEFDHFYD